MAMDSRLAYVRTISHGNGRRANIHKGHDMAKDSRLAYGRTISHGNGRQASIRKNNITWGMGKSIQ